MFYLCRAQLSLVLPTIIGCNWKLNVERAWRNKIYGYANGIISLYISYATLIKLSVRTLRERVFKPNKNSSNPSYKRFNIRIERIRGIIERRRKKATERKIAARILCTWYLLHCLYPIFHLKACWVCPFNVTGTAKPPDAVLCTSIATLVLWLSRRSLIFPLSLARPLSEIARSGVFCFALTPVSVRANERVESKSRENQTRVFAIYSAKEATETVRQ